MTTRITCHGITKSYGENVVLKDLDFWVDAGELVTLVSPSGGGKTTLLNILGGLTTADQGVVEVAGQDLSRLDEDGRAGCASGGPCSVHVGNRPALEHHRLRGWARDRGG